MQRFQPLLVAIDSEVLGPLFSKWGGGVAYATAPPCVHVATHYAAMVLSPSSSSLRIVTPIAIAPKSSSASAMTRIVYVSMPVFGSSTTNPKSASMYPSLSASWITNDDAVVTVNIPSAATGIEPTTSLTV